MSDERLRNLPSVDALLAEDGGRLRSVHGREPFLKAVRAALDRTREAILAGSPEESPSSPVSRAEILERAARILEESAAPSIRQAVNATGILLHSGIGRAVLSDAALRALDGVAQGYCTLALEIETGRRGHRDVHVAGLLRELTGAEAATICNNNAAATVLVLNSLARGREVILSRGQLVEIGGSFRMPEVMETSGAILREVGTTNKTHLRDYAAAIGPDTGAILRVHHSNYRIRGFHSEPGIEELAALGAEKGIPVIDDLGSGALVDLAAYGLETEPLVRRSIAAGVAAACFSGDKLIGGPQSGLIVGTAEAIGRIKKNPLARAFRCGKLTLAAMEATLKLFRAPDLLEERHPLYRMLSADPKDLARRAKRVAKSLSPALPTGIALAVEDGESQVGGGAVPVETLPSKVLALRASGGNPGLWSRRLREMRPAVVARVREDAVLFDFRTILPGEDAAVEAAIRRLLEESR